MSSAGQNKKEGVSSRDYRIFTGVGQACLKWIRCIEPPSRPKWFNEADFEEAVEKEWVKKCPRCLIPNPGIRLHCERCRRIWLRRGN